MASTSPPLDERFLRVDGLEPDVRACSANLFGREVRLFLYFLYRNHWFLKI